MKREELFEVLEPPPHGLTRLRGRMATRQANRWLRPALLMAFAATMAALLFVPRDATEPGPKLEVSLLTPLLQPQLGAPPVSALDGSKLAVERLPSANPKVVLYRVAVLPEIEEP
jgi:hypothetical protein